MRQRQRFWATDEQLYQVLDAHDAKVRAGEAEPDKIGFECDGYYPCKDIREQNRNENEPAL